MRSLTSKDLRPINLLILSNIEINEQADAVIIALGGDVCVSAPVDGVILSLFTKTVSTQRIKYGIISLKYFALPFDLAAGLAVLAVFKDTAEQVAAYILKNGRSSLKFGLYGYIMALLLIGVFFISVAGSPVALAGLAALMIIAAAGHIPVSVALGFCFGSRFSRYNTFTLFMTGSVIIDLVKLIPVFGDVFTLFVMPVASLGAFSVYIIHKHFYKSYAAKSFEKRGSYDRHKIKAIVLKSIDRSDIK